MPTALSSTSSVRRKAMSKRTFTVTYGIVGTILADTKDEAIETMQESYDAHLDPDHVVIVTAHDDSDFVK
jgi:hypothetical protein